jgi:hypothetical protein
MRKSNVSETFLLRVACAWLAALFCCVQSALAHTNICESAFDPAVEIATTKLDAASVGDSPHTKAWNLNFKNILKDVYPGSLASTDSGFVALVDSLGRYYSHRIAALETGRFKNREAINYVRSILEDTIAITSELSANITVPRQHKLIARTLAMFENSLDSLRKDAAKKEIRDLLEKRYDPRSDLMVAAFRKALSHLYQLAATLAVPNAIGLEMSIADLPYTGGDRIESIVESRHAALEKALERLTGNVDLPQLVELLNKQRLLDPESYYGLLGLEEALAYDSSWATNRSIVKAIVGRRLRNVAIAELLGVNPHELPTDIDLVVEGENAIYLCEVKLGGLKMSGYARAHFEKQLLKLRVFINRLNYGTQIRLPKRVQFRLMTMQGGLSTQLMQELDLKRDEIWQPGHLPLVLP